MMFLFKDFSKRGTLFKGRQYLRKYGISFEFRDALFLQKKKTNQYLQKKEVYLTAD